MGNGFYIQLIGYLTTNADKGTVIALCACK
jgi:hypothetical protein